MGRVGTRASPSMMGCAWASLLGTRRKVTGQKLLEAQAGKEHGPGRRLGSKTPRARSQFPRTPSCPLSSPETRAALPLPRSKSERSTGDP